MLTIKRLELVEAKVLLRGAAAKAAELGVPMCIAVVDDSGHLIAFERMDGGKITSVTIAQDKAFTAAASRKATHEMNRVCVPGELTFGIHTEVGGRFSIVGGGLPVFVGEVVVGGIGISSGTPQQDMQCAEAALISLADFMGSRDHA